MLSIVTAELKAIKATLCGLWYERNAQGVDRGVLRETDSASANKLEGSEDRKHYRGLARVRRACTRGQAVSAPEALADAGEIGGQSSHPIRAGLRVVGAPLKRLRTH